MFLISKIKIYEILSWMNNLDCKFDSVLYSKFTVQTHKCLPILPWPLSDFSNKDLVYTIPKFYHQKVGAFNKQ